MPKLWQAATTGLAACALACLLAGASSALTGDNSLEISPIHASFVETERATTYSVPTVVDAPGAKISYRWTLTLEPVDASVGIDPGCKNHGELSGTDATFVWHHGNTGDPDHDDGCDHSKQGRYGHQGLITVVVTDSDGRQCKETYRGTNSSTPNSADNGTASAPTCTLVGLTTPAGCHCSLLTVRIVPSSVTLSKGEKFAHMEVAFHWQLNCSKGDGGCEAVLSIAAPSGKLEGKPYTTYLTIKHLRHYREQVFCRGECGEITEGTTELELFVTGSLAIRTERTFGSVPFVVKRTCQGKPLASLKLSIAFDELGSIDLEKSKLR